MAKNNPHEDAEREVVEKKKDMVPESPPKTESSVPETKKDELITDKSVEDPTNDGSQQNWFWFPIGIAIGTAMGIATDDLGFWLSMGVALGLLLSVIGVPLSSNKDNKN